MTPPTSLVVGSGTFGVTAAIELRRRGHPVQLPDPGPLPHPLAASTGGSGHAYKFAPVLGGLIADIVEGQPNPHQHKFRWRPEVRLPRSQEEARFQSSERK